MSSALPRPLLEIAYAEAAREYARNLPLEHFMESIGQSTQRKITVESLDLVHARRPEVQVFSELLVQYPHGKGNSPRQVVPDNMVVIHPEPIKAEGSYDVPFQPVKPFWVMEYVSKNNKRKDYEDSFQKYERDLKVPYYLVFYPENQELTLFRHSKGRFVTVKPNSHDRFPIPKLELEMGLLGDWLRFWFQGELLPLPADLQRDLDATRKQLAVATRQLEKERQARRAAEEELTRLRAQIEEMRARRKNGS
jgi:Uma2 family endonuclease